MKLVSFLSFVSLACTNACAVSTDASIDAPAEESSAESEPLRRKNALTAAQEATALKLVDDVCGDTWCSGDYNFAFRHLTCSTASSSCKLDLQIMPREGAPGYPKRFRRSCTTPAFSGFPSVVRTTSSGYSSLDWDYYLALTECIGKLEAALAG